MKHNSRIIPLLVIALCATVAAPALAQDATIPPGSEPAPGTTSSITIGAAAVYLPDYEGSDDYRLVPGPAAVGSIGGFSFALVGTRLSIDLVPNTPGPNWDIQAGPIGVLNLSRTSAKGIEDVRVRTLNELNTGIEVGAFVGVGKTGVITSEYDRLSVSISYRKDVGRASKGGVLQPGINYLTPVSRKAAVGLFASGEIISDRYARYYYSVSSMESVASGLPVYTAGGGAKSFTLGGLGSYSLTGDILQGVKLVAGGTYKRLCGDVSESPIVSIAGDREQWLGAIGLAYTF